MGVAAESRVLRASLLEFRRKSFQSGDSSWDPDAPTPKPTPRPANWGEKTLERAKEAIRVQLRGTARVAEYRNEKPDFEAVFAYMPQYLHHERGFTKAVAEKAIAAIRKETK